MEGEKYGIWKRWGKLRGVLVSEGLMVRVRVEVIKEVYVWEGIVGRVDVIVCWVGKMCGWMGGRGKKDNRFVGVEDVVGLVWVGVYGWGEVGEEFEEEVWSWGRVVIVKEVRWGDESGEKGDIRFEGVVCVVIDEGDCGLMGVYVVSVDEEVG